MDKVSLYVCLFLRPGGEGLEGRTEHADLAAEGVDGLQLAQAGGLQRVHLLLQVQDLPQLARFGPLRALHSSTHLSSLAHVLW